MSIGRSSSFSGPLTAFSFPLGSIACSADSVAFTTLGAGALVHTPSACPCMSPVCASSCEGEKERAAFLSECSGDAVIGVPGVESGESAMMVRRRRVGGGHIGSRGRVGSQVQRQHDNLLLTWAQGLPASREVGELYQTRPSTCGWPRDPGSRCTSALPFAYPLRSLYNPLRPLTPQLATTLCAANVTATSYEQLQQLAVGLVT